MKEDEQGSNEEVGCVARGGTAERLARVRTEAQVRTYTSAQRRHRQRHYRFTYSTVHLSRDLQMKFRLFSVYVLFIFRPREENVSLFAIQLWTLTVIKPEQVKVPQKTA